MSILKEDCLRGVIETGAIYLAETWIVTNIIYRNDCLDATHDFYVNCSTSPQQNTSQTHTFTWKHQIYKRQLEGGEPNSQGTAPGEK